MYGAHSSTWKSALAALWAWAEEHGDVRSAAGADGVDLSRWITTRRHEHRNGHLDPEQVAQLQALPGWSWGNGQQEQWATTFALLCEYAAERGTARVPAAHVVGDVKLGTWVSRQRAVHRRGELGADRVRALQRLPGWVWNPGR